MTKNVKGIERILRIAAGLLLLSLTVFVEGNARWWGLVGLVPLLSGLTSICPAKSIFGRTGCRQQCDAT
ncbi:DUF2892 domain-containing protein [Mesorhizobium sp. ANAO-SY3R2]|uniref:YgaP family membrane protein n=1 Tax=Mesorhizobium sp. ANAO-SY3R2 TaxID=3166644 RepID=UPI0036707EE9